MYACLIEGTLSGFRRNHRGNRALFCFWEGGGPYFANGQSNGRAGGASGWLPLQLCRQRLQISATCGFLPKGEPPKWSKMEPTGWCPFGLLFKSNQKRVALTKKKQDTHGSWLSWAKVGKLGPRVVRARALPLVGAGGRSQLQSSPLTRTRLPLKGA